jgi:putative aminopeptidase FrvX
MYELLRNLCDIVGPSGFEQDVQRFILNEIKDYVDEYHVDAVGNLIVKKSGNDSKYPSLVIAAHTDEIGFIVKKIEDNGLIRFEKLGGFDDRILPSLPVFIKSDKGNVNGVIGTISAHYVKWDDPKRVSSHRELYMDVGARSAEDVKEMGIRVGQPISYGTAFKRIGSNRVVGKALDDRAGCALLIRLLQSLHQSDAKHGDIYGAFTVQEEVGLRGASVVSAAVQPDFALALDTTPTSDTFDVLMTGTRVLGDGPCIKIVDKSLIAHPLVTGHLEKVAVEGNIPHQMEVFMGIGTDAGAIHMTNKGVSSGVISIPSRFTHTPIEVVDLEDMENSYKLLHGFVVTLDQLRGKTFLDT